MLFFEFPENASWNDKRDCVEFSVILGPYEGTVRVPRRVFQGLLDQRPTMTLCLLGDHAVDFGTAAAALTPDFIAGEPMLVQVPSETADWRAVDTALAGPAQQ
jgi:hypothetical protein